MKSKDLKNIIASDKYNLLRDNQTRVGYFILRMKYKIELNVSLQSFLIG